MDAVVTIHGGVGREDRLKIQESFRHDPQVQVLIATDAAGVQLHAPGRVVAAEDAGKKTDIP